jgi:uncharacterized membrane protein YvbJ
MYCPQCGSRANDKHAWCQECGAVFPTDRAWSIASAREGGLLSRISDPGARIIVIAVAGVVAMLILGEVLRFVVALVLPLILVVAILYWASERRRRLYRR